METQNIEKLRKLIAASIKDCRNVLKEADNDVEKAFDLLKQYKMAPIVQKTGISVNEAFEIYKQCNSDIEKTMERILYIKKAPIVKETEYLPDMFRRSKDGARILNRILAYLAREIGSKEYDTFMALLPSLKDNWQLFDYYGQEFTKTLIELLIKNNNMVNSEEYKNQISKADEFDRQAIIQRNNMDRSLLIETIINSINTDEADILKKKYWVENYSLNKLLDDYVVLCNDNMCEDAAHCLNNFIDLGISSVEVFTKLAENLEDKEHTIAILSRMNIYEWGEIPDRFSELLMEVKKAARMLGRSNAICQFLLVVHPLCGENVNKSTLQFSYFSYAGACYDWSWSSSRTADRMVEAKILSLREAKIFEKLGDILLKEDNLNSIKIRELYGEFFRGKDPFDVIYTLPD
ncbi:hypothetical protein [Clostridium sp. JS66]|uniref:hypothetical protein n=1 Tax=Clostridium sp. JS66 TaxID=3064705 RepID=UPI00298D8B37|nr:hypothetical protein [Clostridium sp. JS66]WPC43405.1 hypothetical protein Q6H37_08015 [Clostridium sp. JS66]